MLLSIFHMFLVSKAQLTVSCSPFESALLDAHVSSAVHIGAIGAMSPTIQDNDRRHSSTFILDHTPDHNLRGQRAANHSYDTSLSPHATSPFLVPPSPSYLDSGSQPRYSSNSESDRSASGGGRMSNILRGFPTPPDITPAAAAVLGTYFSDLLRSDDYTTPAESVPAKVDF